MCSCNSAAAHGSSSLQCRLKPALFCALFGRFQVCEGDAGSLFKENQSHLPQLPSFVGAKVSTLWPCTAHLKPCAMPVTTALHLQQQSVGQMQLDKLSVSAACSRHCGSFHAGLCPKLIDKHCCNYCCRLAFPIGGVADGEPLMVELFDRDFRAKEFLGQVRLLSCTCMVRLVL